MAATLTDFHYGAVTPVAAYLMACLGSALGLRCTVRSMRQGARGRKNGWLSLAAVSMGCGIWTMHFIAMTGFSVEGSDISFDTGMTLLSLAVAIGVTAVGVFLVGHLGSRAKVLVTAGVFMGLGVAAMHYIGMAAMQVHGSMHYDTTAVAASVLIAVIAATAALWAAVTIRSLWSSLGASLVMGVAVTGMHYTGMAAVSVDLDHSGVTSSQSSIDQLSFMLAMIVGPVVVLLLSAVVVTFDPDLVLGDEPGTERLAEAARPVAPTAFAQQGQPAHQGPYEQYPQQGQFGQYEYEQQRPYTQHEQRGDRSWQ
ncbi:MHYT domain-containing protein [Streptomyces sp. BE230]|uniref:MHYT domain-containing protein n=1 Tax=Streptomyces sp. BE230 TaxID=3002526 RepID=UPI002ECFD3FB|nr:MHYT domain-containing protein [Streptomyces sp. BE230]